MSSSLTVAVRYPGRSVEPPAAYRPAYELQCDKHLHFYVGCRLAQRDQQAMSAGAAPAVHFVRSVETGNSWLLTYLLKILKY